jgi:signal peptidase I
MSASSKNGITQSVLGEMWREACDRGMKLSFRIASNSMAPLLKTGDIVKVAKVQPSRVHIGDIVAFQDGKNVVVHRIIGKSPSNTRLVFRQMGDGGGLSGEIPAQNLIGRVIVIEKEGFEINLDSRRHIISNRILGWRLQLLDSLSKAKYRRISLSVRFILRPVWGLCRRLLFWRL